MGPVAIAFAVIAVAATAVSAVAAQQQQNQANKANAALEDRNRRVLDQQKKLQQDAALREEEVTKQAVIQKQKQNKMFLASNIQQAASQGIDFSGSAYDVFDQNNTETALDTLNVQNAGDVKKYNILVGATNTGNQAGNAAFQSEIYKSRVQSPNYIGIAAQSAQAGLGAYTSAGGTFGSTTSLQRPASNPPKVL